MPAIVPALTKRAQSLPGKVVLTFTLDKHVSSSSPPAQSSVPSQACSSGMNLTEPLQKKYLLSISFLTAVGKRGSGSGHDMASSHLSARKRRRRRNGHSLKKAAVVRMARNTTTAKTVSTTRFLLDDLSFSVVGVLIGLLWRPGRGKAGAKGTRQH